MNVLEGITNVNLLESLQEILFFVDGNLYKNISYFISKLSSLDFRIDFNDINLLEKIKIEIKKEANK